MKNRHQRRAEVCKLKLIRKAIKKRIVRLEAKIAGEATA